MMMRFIQYAWFGVPLKMTPFVKDIAQTELYINISGKNEFSVPLQVHQQMNLLGVPKR